MSLAGYASAEPSYSTKSAWRVTKAVDVSRQSRTRKGAKARTWTEAEERFLIDSRSQRVQYKRIAARLQKSELACRLHYHQLTKHRPSIDIEMCDAEDYGSLQVTPRASPCPSNITPPTNHDGMEHLKLPSLNALFDDSTHRRSISLPGKLNVPFTQSQRQLTPPAYILPPPRVLLSPFDETRALQATVDAQRLHLPAPSEFHSHSQSHPHGHGGHHRTLSCQDNLHYRTSYVGTSPNLSYFDTPRPALPMYNSTTGNERCSVNALLNHHGSFTI